MSGLCVRRADAVPRSQRKVPVRADAACRPRGPRSSAAPSGGRAQHGLHVCRHPGATQGQRSQGDGGCAPTTRTSPQESRLADARGPDVASQPPLRLGLGHVTRAPPIRGAGAASAGMRRRAAALRPGGVGRSRRALASGERLRCFPVQSPEGRAGAARGGALPVPATP